MLVCFVQNGNGRFLAGAKINLLTRHLKPLISWLFLDFWARQSAESKAMFFTIVFFTFGLVLMRLAQFSSKIKNNNTCLSSLGLLMATIRMLLEQSSHICLAFVSLLLNKGGRYTDTIMTRVNHTLTHVQYMLLVIFKEILPNCSPPPQKEMTLMILIELPKVEFNLKETCGHML